AGTGNDRAFEGADGGIVGFAGGFQTAADFFEVIGETADAVVKESTKRGDFLGVYGNGFLTQTVRSGFEQRDERRRSGEQDFFRDRSINQAGVALQRAGEELVAGQEENDEFRRGLELRPIIFRA